MTKTNKNEHFLEVFMYDYYTNIWMYYNAL